MNQDGSLGAPALSLSVADSGGTATSGVVFVDLVARNSGNAHAIDAHLEEIRLRVLAGSGAVALDLAQSPGLPLRLGDLAPGASVSTRLFVLVDPGVARFAVAEKGSNRDVSGRTLRFSSARGVDR